MAYRVFTGPEPCSTTLLKVIYVAIPCILITLYHIETHYQSQGFEPLSLVVYHDFFGQASNVFLYGGGRGNRILLDSILARDTRSPLLPPYTTE